jgi:hypothetical protein
MTLVLEDPGGGTLHRFLPAPMELTRFLRFAAGIATALSGLHEKGADPQGRKASVASPNPPLDLRTGRH